MLASDSGRTSKSVMPNEIAPKSDEKPERLERESSDRLYTGCRALEVPARGW